MEGQKKTNEFVLKKLKTKRQLLATVLRQRQLQYFGHIKRHQSIKKDILEGKVEGKRARGRQRTMWTDNIKTSSKLTLAQCTKKCQDREGWRVVASRPLRKGRQNYDDDDDAANSVKGALKLRNK